MGVDEVSSLVDVVDVPVRFQCSNCGTVFKVERRELENYFREKDFGGGMVIPRWVAECPPCIQEVVIMGFRE